MKKRSRRSPTSDFFFGGRLFSTNGIKAVLFDLDGTLRLYTPSGGDVFTKYVRGLGISISSEDVIRASRWEHYYFANSPEIRADQQTFKESRESFWLNFTRRRLIALGLHPSRAIDLSKEVSAYMAEAYKPQVHVADDLRGMLPELQNAGYVLGVVSNREKPYQNELEEMGLDSHFKFSLAGGEVSSYKPEPDIFLRALEMAGTHAHETIYVGDNYFADVVGARRAGLRPVLYDPGSLFPESECPAIKSFDELKAVIKSM